MKTKKEADALVKSMLTVSETAVYMDITENKVREILRAGTLRGYKKLNKWFIFISDIHEYIISPAPAKVVKTKKIKQHA